jgi:hypothetical protein
MFVPFHSLLENFIKLISYNKFLFLAHNLHHHEQTINCEKTATPYSTTRNKLSSEVREYSEEIKEYNVEASVVLAASSGQRLEVNSNEDDIRCGDVKSGARLVEDSERLLQNQRTALTSQFCENFSSCRASEVQEPLVSAATSSTAVFQEGSTINSSCRTFCSEVNSANWTHDTISSEADDGGEKQIGGRHFAAIRDCIAELESAEAVTVGGEGGGGHGEAAVNAPDAEAEGIVEKKLTSILQGSALRSILLSNVETAAEEETDTDDLNKDDNNTDTEACLLK